MQTSKALCIGVIQVYDCEEVLDLGSLLHLGIYAKLVHTAFLQYPNGIVSLY